MTQAVRTPANARAESRLRGLRGAAFGAIIMLTIQLSLGTWVNLFATLPASDQGKGLLAALGDALTAGPLGLTIHALLGLALLGAGLAAVIRAILMRAAVWIVVTLVALAAIVLAGVNGTRFVGTGSNGASFVMALAEAIALACYAIVLFLAAPDAQ